MINADNIPPELKSQVAWVIWRYERVKNRQTKVPYDPKKVSRKADSTDPETWGTFEQAMKTAPFFSGIGFVIRSPYLGIDYDHIRDKETGVIPPDILNEILAVGSYADISPSGEGVHCICKGMVPGDGRQRNQRAIYDRGRYLTMSTVLLDGAPMAINDAAPGSLEAIYTKMQEGKEEPHMSKIPKRSEPVDFPDDAVIDLCRKARNGPKFERLWSGNWSGYASQSEADLALCAILAFYTPDPIQIDSLFRRSGLFRDKWDAPRGGSTYGVITVSEALDGTTEVYTPPKKKPEPRFVEPAPQPMDPSIQEKAMEILQAGDPILYIMEQFGRIHIGDEGIGRFLIISEGCQLVVNSDGVQPGLGGISGAGKSHACRTMYFLNPEKYKRTGSLSKTALYYGKILPKTIFFFDDLAVIDDDLEQSMKESMSNFRIGCWREVTTRNKDGQFTTERKQIPPYLTWWITSQDLLQDEQVKNRLLMLSVDEREDQDGKVCDHQLQQAYTGTDLWTETTEVKTCRAIFEILKDSDSVQVKIPFPIRWNLPKKNRRLLQAFLDTVMAITALRQYRRGRDADGFLLVEREDFNDAVMLWNNVQKEQRSKQPPANLQALQALLENGDKDVLGIVSMDRQKLLQVLGWNPGKLARILFGRRRPDGTQVGGLDQLDGLDIEQGTKSIKIGDTTRTIRFDVIRYSGEFNPLDEFSTVATIEK